MTTGFNHRLSSRVHFTLGASPALNRRAERAKPSSLKVSGDDDCHARTDGNSDSALYEDVHDQIRSLADYALLFVDDPLLFEPGTQFGYSNSGFIVLGLIIQEVTGQDYYDYVRENIFEPAGMTNTAAYELDAGTPNLAIGYTYLDEEGNETDVLTDNSFVMPMRGGSAGGGFSTVEDLLKFGNALLDHQFLSPASTELLLEGKIRLGETSVRQ